MQFGWRDWAPSANLSYRLHVDDFLHLQTRISRLENELADRREFYNDSVNRYNIRIQSIPDIIIAKMLQYKEEKMFKVAAADKQNVKIQV